MQNHQFGIPINDKCRDVIVTLLNFEKWGVRFVPIAVFDDLEKISRPVLSRLTGVAGKSYSILVSARERMPEYLSEQMVACN